MEQLGKKESSMEKKKDEKEPAAEPQKPGKEGPKVITDDDMHASIGEKTEKDDPTYNEEQAAEMLKPSPSKGIN